MSYFYFEQNTVSKTLFILGQCTWSTGNKSYFLLQYDKIRLKYWLVVQVMVIEQIAKSNLIVWVKKKKYNIIIRLSVQAISLHQILNLG